MVLGMSPKTVEYHRASLFKRLGVNNLVTLTKWAIRNGLTTI